MRMTATLTIAAAALLAAAPAVAQNTGEAANATDLNAAVPATDTANAAAPVAVDTNTTTAETTTTETTPAAPPEEKKSFPWGVIGLVGLLGLIPRARRNR